MRTWSRRRTWLLVALATLAVLVAGCTGPSNGQNSLHPKGTDAKKIDDLFIPVVAVATIIGIFIFVAVVYCAIRFRRRPGNERPKQIHGNTALEIRRVELGQKGVWYRVVLPTSSFQQATETCASIKSNGGDCIPNNG